MDMLDRELPGYADSFSKVIDSSGYLISQSLLRTRNQGSDRATVQNQ